MSRCYKHGAESLRRARHRLDWANMLDPLHHYEGVPVLDLPAPERQHSMCFKGRQAPRLRVTDRAMMRSLTSVCPMPGWQKDLLFAWKDRNLAEVEGWANPHFGLGRLPGRWRIGHYKTAGRAPPDSLGRPPGCGCSLR